MRNPERLLPFLVIVSSILFASCKKKDTVYRLPEFPPTSIFDSVVDMTPAYAHGFKVRYLSDGTPLIDIANPQDGDGHSADTIKVALIQRGHSPLSIPDDYLRLIVPIRSVVCTDVSQIAFFVGLDSLSIIKGIPTNETRHSTIIEKMLENGGIKLTGTPASPDLEAIRRLSPDVVLLSPTLINDKRIHDINGIKIPVYSSLEQHPLAQAEWIKLFAMLIGKEKYGSDYFGKAEQHYNEARNSILDVKTHPTLSLLTKKGDDLEPIPAGHLLNRIVTDAGARAASLSQDSNQAANRHTGSDLAVYWHSATDSEMLLYDEAAPVVPDVMIRDMISIVHPEVIPRDSVWVRRYIHSAP